MKRLRRSLLPLFLLLAIALGGSSSSPASWSNSVLQLLAIIVGAWALARRPSDDLTQASRELLILFAVGVVVVIAQLLPLPPPVWSALPGRDLIIGGYSALGWHLPWMPIALAPYAALGSLLALLPAAAVLVCAIFVAQRERWLAVTLLLAVFAGVVLGALQVSSGDPSRSPWYLYRITNDGAVGFFANRNHMGSLLLVSIPFGVALMASATSRSSDRSRTTGLLAFGAVALLTVVGGIVLNRSLAAVALILPVLLLSGLLLPAGWQLRRFALPAGAIAMMACVFLLTNSPIAPELVSADRSSFTSRQEIWSQTLQLAWQAFPAGTGLGSFASVYPLLEDPAVVTHTYVNHAHNEYLEIILELGLAGLLLVLAFLTWWGRQVVRVWKSALSSQYARAATIASGTLLAHSFVDYPLRTASISVIFALCVALMAQPRRQPRRAEHAEVRPTKHLTIE